MITGFPKLWGWGSAAWKFFPHYPVFFSDGYPNVVIADSKREKTREAIGTKAVEETQYSKVEQIFARTFAKNQNTDESV